ncbi:unnamed protein product [Colias eurytheme]|nr:unnamed protein product [Colias eurytheme]
MARNNLVLKIVLDFIALVIVAFPLLALQLWASPYERGYFADDPSLRLPYKTQTVSEGLLAGLGFALLVVTIIIVEISRDVRGKSGGARSLGNCEIPAWVWESYVAIGVFTFGAACQQLTVNIAKYVIGRLRPHFFDLCKPVPIDASTADSYITNFRCTGAAVTASTMKDMRLSFPSAHSGFAMYCAVFFIFYIQVKAKWRGSKLLRHVAQFGVLIAAWYVGLSRVVDHMHHWSDVAVGFAVGAAFAVLTFIYVYAPVKRIRRESWITEPSTQPEMLPRPVLMAHSN